MVDDSPAGPAREEPAKHPLVVTHAATYLIYTFFAGQPVDIHKVAHKLMNAGVAETAYSAAIQQVRVAPRYGGLLGIRHQAAAIREYLSGPLTLRSGLRLIWKYPQGSRRLIRLVTVITRARIRVWLHQHNPFREQRPLREQRPPVDEPTVSDETTDDDPDDVVEVARQVIQQMQEVEDDVVDAVARTQSVGAIQVLIDEKLLKPGYLQTEPYLRLGLRNTRHRFVREPDAPMVGGTTREKNVGEDAEPSAFTNSGPESAADDASSARNDVSSPADGGWVEVDALAMLHRTGVVQLMLRVELPERVTGSDLVGKVTSKAPVIAASAVPEPLLEPTRIDTGAPGFAGEWQDDLAEGARWRQVEFAEPIDFDAVFNLYFTAFAHAMPSHNPNWRCYPVLIANGVGCGCDRQHGVERHKTDLARMMLQLDAPDIFRAPLIDDALHDVSNVNDSSLYLTEARGARIYWGRDRETNLPDDLFILIPIEQALLLEGQLSSLEWQFTQAAAEPKDLEKLEESVITGLEEFRSSQITASDAQALVDRILDKVRVRDQYSRLTDSVNQLHQKVTAADSRRRAARSNLLAFFAVLVAVALGLPAIKQSIDIAETVPDDSALAPTAQPLVWLGDQGPAGLWGVFLVMVAVTLGVWLIGITYRRGRRRRDRRRPAGHAWDINLEVRFGDNESATPEEDNQPHR